MLISDADIPLYDPFTFYQQLMHETGSKVQACPFDGSQSEFWRAEMEVRTAAIGLLLALPGSLAAPWRLL